MLFPVITLTPHQPGTGRADVGFAFSALSPSISADHVLPGMVERVARCAGVDLAGHARLLATAGNPAHRTTARRTDRRVVAAIKFGQGRLFRSGSAVYLVSAVRG